MSSAHAEPRLMRLLLPVAAFGVTALLLMAPLGVAQAQDGHGVGPAQTGGTLLDQITSQLHLDPKIIAAQAVGFLVMFYILWRLVFRRVGGLLDHRRDNIVSRMEQIERDQQEAARVLSETEQRLGGIEREAQERIAQAVRQGEERAAEIEAEARGRSDAEIERATETIVRERDTAILAVRTEVADLVVQATRQILGESLDEGRQRQIVEEMIGRLSADA